MVSSCLDGIKVGATFGRVRDHGLGTLEVLLPTGQRESENNDGDESENVDLRDFLGLLLDGPDQRFLLLVVHDGDALSVLAFVRMYHDNYAAKAQQVFEKVIEELV